MGHGSGSVKIQDITSIEIVICNTDKNKNNFNSTAPHPKFNPTQPQNINLLKFKNRRKKN